MMSEQWLNITIGCACALLFIVLCLYLTFYQFRKSYPEFPSLPGPFKYISVSYHRVPGRNRFKIFYPTSLSNIKSSNSKYPETYFTDAESLDIFHSIEDIPMLFLNTMNNLQSSRNPIPYTLNAPIQAPSTSNSKYPLLIFSHGHFTNFDLYTAICCGLASYGVIVVIADHTDGSATFTTLSDGTHLGYKPTHKVSSKGATYTDDVLEYGQRRLKPIRVPEFKALYEYLRSGDEIEDDQSLKAILNAADFENVVFGGQSFGGVTSWMASREYEGEGNVKCLLLLDPWFGCLDEKDLEEMDWSLPAYIMSSEDWIQNKKWMKKCMGKVIRNGSNENTEWQYAKRAIHHDFCDVPMWGPQTATKGRNGYTAQDWFDLISKRSMSFVVQQIPKMKEWVKEQHLDYASHCLVDVQDEREASPLSE